MKKYIKKFQTDPKNVYINKIFRYMSEDNLNNFDSLVGGGDPIKYGDCGSILNFLKKKCSETKETINKYLVILYGPPGSGKSSARKIACNIIKTNYGENLSEKEIGAGFIDTGIDEITYDIVGNDDKEQVRELLIKNLKEQLKLDANGLQNFEKIGQNDKTVIEEYTKEINNNKPLLESLASSSFKIYRNNRKDALSELLYFFAISVNKNIFIEFASPQTDYLDKILALITYHGYTPIFLYPFVSKSKILCDRAIKRGLGEGRFINCDGANGIEHAMKNCLAHYGDMKKVINNSKSYYILQYDADFGKEVLDKIDAYNFTDFDKYKLEYEFVKESTENDLTVRTHYTYRSKQYNDKVTLKFGDHQDLITLI